MTKEQARKALVDRGIETSEEAWAALSRFGYIPEGMDRADFDRLYGQLMFDDRPRTLPGSPLSRPTSAQ